MAEQPDRPVKLTRHADHDPSLICRPALGYGLCEVLESCPVVFVPRDPECCPRCTCDRSADHNGHHHCPDCGVWYTLASDVESA